MKKKYLLISLGVIFLILTVWLAVYKQTKPPRSQEGVGRLSGGEELRSPVVSITTIKEKAGRVDWSHKLNLIAFDQKSDNWYFNIYIMRPDGSDTQCLTCDKSGLPGKHMGNPAWHPGGDYIVFQAEKRVYKGEPIASRILALPGYGINNDLWLITRDGKRYYQLTDVPEGMGVLHPHFSHDGSKLTWAERLKDSGKGGWYGEWALKVADFVIDGKGPHLENVKAYQPGGKVFYETDDFSKDDTKIFFSGNLEPNQPEVGADIYTLELKTQKLERLTATIDQWDEFAHYSPSGNKIIWISTTGCKCDPKKLLDVKTDYWIMNADGSDKRRLTYFNDPNHIEYTGQRLLAADSSWSPDGIRLAALLLRTDGGLEGNEGKIVIIAFDSPQ